jgi:hypothetical protein
MATVRLSTEQVTRLAGLLADMTDRPGPDPAARQECRWWSAHLAGLLRAASAATAAALGQQPFIPGPPALRWSA